MSWEIDCAKSMALHGQAETPVHSQPREVQSYLNSLFPDMKQRSGLEVIKFFHAQLS